MIITPSALFSLFPFRSGILDSFIYQIGMMMEDDLTRRNEQTGYYHQIREDTDGRADGRPGCERKAL